jgi:hypothetical protein
MSSETQQYIAEVLALSPWIAFVVVIAWFWLLELRDNARASRAQERARPRESERIERSPRANA